MQKEIVANLVKNDLKRSEAANNMVKNFWYFQLYNVFYILSFLFPTVSPLKGFISHSTLSAVWSESHFKTERSSSHRCRKPHYDIEYC